MKMLSSIMIVLLMILCFGYISGADELSNQETEVRLTHVRPIANEIKISYLDDKTSRIEGEQNDINMKVIITLFLSCFVLFSLFLFWRFSFKKAEMIEAMHSFQHQELLQAIDGRLEKVKIKGKPINREVGVKVKLPEGETFVVLCRHFRDEEGNECWISPFVTKSKQAIHRDKRSALAKSIRGCLKHPEFSEQVALLVKENKIRRF